MDFISLRSRSLAMAVVILMTAVWLTGACPPANGKNVCGDCIRNRMDMYCRGCAPPLRCMAECLWGGGSRSSCVKRCDSGGAWQKKLSSCRRCMSSCKCSCTPSSSV